MQSRRLLCVAAIGAMLASTAFADTWNKKTKVTFSAPVQVPGASLSAGTYVFRLLDSQSNRHIVQVVNVREDHVYATILAIPDYRLNATSKTVMYFSESAAGGAVPLKSWFYPGDNFGQRFIYPKAKAQEIAVATSQSVPAYDAPAVKADAAPEVVLSGTTKMIIVQPTKVEAPYEVAQLEKRDAQDTAGVDGQAVRDTPPANLSAAAAPAPTPQQLPRSSSPIHLLGGLGGLLAGASIVVRKLSARVR